MPKRTLMVFFNHLYVAINAQKKIKWLVAIFIGAISCPHPSWLKELTIYNNLLNTAYIILFILLCILLINAFKEREELNLLEVSSNTLLNFEKIKKLKLIKRVALIGLSSTGKTTFINKLGHRHPTNARTQEISGKIIKLKGKALCFIDISGEKLVQLFQVIEYADIIIFIVDHSDSNSGKLKRSRIDETKKLLNTLKDHWDSLENKKSIPSIVLINKKDLWKKAKSNDQCQFLQEYKTTLYNTVQELFGHTSKIYEYSNKEESNAIVELDEIIDFIIKNT